MVIHDQFTALAVSKQRRYQLRREAKGLCSQCGEKAVSGMIHCERCHDLALSRNRQRRGCKKRLVNTKFNRARGLTLEAAANSVKNDEGEGVEDDGRGR